MGGVRKACSGRTAGRRGSRKEKLPGLIKEIGEPNLTEIVVTGNYKTFILIPVQIFIDHSAQIFAT